LNRLYTSKDLLQGYVAGKSASYVKTWDFQQFIAYTKAGGPEPKYLKDRLRQARHDAQIGYALAKYLEQHGAKQPLVGIMGSHSLPRNSTAFKVIADIARDLTGHGYWIVSGGGPGAMEAAHFGAYFAGSKDEAYASALAQLKTQPRLPDNLDSILDNDGGLAAGQEDKIKAAYDWLTAALAARNMADGKPRRQPGRSDVALWRRTDDAFRHRIREVFPEQHSRGNPRYRRPQRRAVCAGQRGDAERDLSGRGNQLLRRHRREIHAYDFRRSGRLLGKGCNVRR
jgi:hypothetical protein